jgi:DNA-directed RNA polymerase specialized sigma24 family protein
VKTSPTEPELLKVEQLYREHGPRLWRAVLGYAGNREVASDAVAEAFAQLIRRGNAVRSPERWVWRAAFRVAAGELSRRERLKPPPEGSYEMEEPSIVLAALRRLSPRQRAAVVSLPLLRLLT